jgi:hypothetical protein
MGTRLDGAINCMQAFALVTEIPSLSFDG